MSIKIPERTLALQGLRFLFITDIVFGHAGNMFLGGGGVECSFFFVVSGFLFTLKPLPYKEYLWRKVKHIYPPYWICLALLLMGFFVKGTWDKLDFGWDIIPHLFLIQSWIPVKDAWFFKYLGPSWFLSSLLFCYAIAPFLYKCVNSYKKWIIHQVILTSVLICIVLENTSPYASWLTYASPIIRSLEFLLGMQLKMLLKVVPYKESQFALFTPILLIVYIAILGYTHWGYHYSFIHAFVIGWLWMFRSRITNVVCGNYVILRLADASLYIYLIQMPILRALGQNISSAIITIIIGYLFFELYQFVESHIILCKHHAKINDVKIDKSNQ